jgi:tRNA(His) guanylyltransferase
MTSSTFFQTIGDRIKSYEHTDTKRVAMRGLPLVARLDGKNFHAYTKGMDKPYDADLSSIFSNVLVDLVDRFQPTVGYTQSDEISLVWWIPIESTHELPYGGRIQKIDSLLAAYTSVKFNSLASIAFPAKQEMLPTFDCRTFCVPTLREAFHTLLWRQQDATKNTISMAAHAHFSHSSLHGMNGSEMQERLFVEKGINFNDYPVQFKRGIFAKRVTRMQCLSQEQLDKIPPLYRPSGPVERSSVELMDIKLSKLPDPLSIFQSSFAG